MTLSILLDLFFRPSMMPTRVGKLDLHARSRVALDQLLAHCPLHQRADRDQARARDVGRLLLRVTQHALDVLGIEQSEGLVAVIKPELPQRRRLSPARALLELL